MLVGCHFAYDVQECILSEWPEDNIYREIRYMSLGSNICFLRKQKKYTQEQQNKFGMHGYVAAYILPEGFDTKSPGVEYSENVEADYAMITIKEPFIRPFERIPTYIR